MIADTDRGRSGRQGLTYRFVATLTWYHVMNAFRQASLALKLLFTVGILLILVTLAFLLYSNWSLGRSEQVIVGEVSEQLEQQVVTGLRAQAGQQAAEVAAAIETLFQYPRALAAQLARTIEDGGEHA